ncbi:hypothetical protein MVEN_00789400 [Mycena venus]|uniref:DUF4139 domain-containing protein n=1 Tax=Mycena venus TaxID=2733690 RepID=A0A8H7D6E7_9AGAR|nr:hypothetical protein MVEN_00789400 [Mycena venus]
MTTTDPPPFEPTSVELQSIADSKIISVSLYPTRAEITRLYKFASSMVKTRVEGRGAATIHDVTLSMVDKPVSNSSPKLEELWDTRETVADSLTRCDLALSSVRQYLGSLTVQNLAVSQLESVLEQYETTGARLDARKAELSRELKRIDAEIKAERAQGKIPPGQNKLRNKATIGVFAQTAGDVEIALIYAVPLASWMAFYDIRVDMDTKETPVKLIYKAAVKQNTGESWDNVPLQLETSTPTFGVDVPKLGPWNLDIHRPPSVSYLIPSQQPVSYLPSQQQPQSAPIIISQSRRSRSRRSRSPPRYHRARRHSMSDEDEEDGEEAMVHEEAAVTSTGNVSATFSVPGLVTIPCDGAAHNFTIVELRPKAVMSWVAVPKRESKTHLTAHITNASDYMLLSGTASVYVDGSFVARSTVPHVSPQEGFDCPLGLDQSIRITYTPIIKKLSQTGFYKKSATHVFTQRITVHNTKNIPIEGLRIVDQIPASRNEQIKVKLVQPALGDGEGTVKGAVQKAVEGSDAKGASVNVSKGVVAQWGGGDEQERRVNWVCTVPAQGKINLALEWTVTISPADAQVVGL